MGRNMVVECHPFDDSGYSARNGHTPGKINRQVFDETLRRGFPHAHDSDAGHEGFGRHYLGFATASNGRDSFHGTRKAAAKFHARRRSQRTRIFL